MVRLEVDGNALGPAVSADVTSRERVLDVCDALRAPIAFSCRSASCGTCLVDVLTGADLLDPPGLDEREVLALFAETPTQRLACQAVIRAGDGLIRLAAVEDTFGLPEASTAKRSPG